MWAVLAGLGAAPFEQLSRDVFAIFSQRGQDQAGLGLCRSGDVLAMSSRYELGWAILENHNLSQAYAEQKHNWCQRDTK